MIKQKDLLILATKTIYNKPRIGKLTINNNTYEIVKININNNSNGVDYMIVKHDNEYIMVFQGSQDKTDWLQTNPTLPATKVNKAIVNSNKYLNIEKQYYNITTVVGHSLGGAQATYVATQNNNLNCITLNSATVPKSITMKSNSKITNFYTNGDPLTLLQQGTQIHSQFGTNIKLNIDNYDLKSFVRNHNAEYLTMFVATSPFTNEIITSEYQPSTIVIDFNSISTLQSFLDTTIIGQTNYLSSKLNSILSTVEKVSTNKSTRIDKLSNNFKNIIIDNLLKDFNTLFTISYDFQNNYLLKEINLILTKLSTHQLSFLFNNNYLFNNMLISPIITLPTSLSTLVNELLSLKMTLTNVAITDVPLLINNVNNVEIDDDFVKQLKSYYEQLLANTKIINHKLKLYRKFLMYLKLQFMINEQNISNKTPIVLSNFYNLTISKIEMPTTLNQGLKERETILEHNFNEFANNVARKLKPNFEHISIQCQRLYNSLNVIYEHIESISILTSKFRNLQITNIPIILLDDYLILLQKLLNNLISFKYDIEYITNYISSVINITHNLSSNFSSLLFKFKPYVLEAIFNDDDLYSIQNYNQLLLNVTSTLQTTFTTINDELVLNNSFKAAHKLQILSHTVLTDFNELNLQIKKLVD